MYNKGVKIDTFCQFENSRSLSNQAALHPKVEALLLPL